MTQKFFSIETYSNMTGEITDITTSKQLEGVETFDEIQDYCIKVANEKKCKGAVRDQFGQRVLCFNYSEHCENNICFSWESEAILNDFIAAHTEEEPEKTGEQKKFEELKAKWPGTIILFRRGDFYETYQEDAREAAKILGITLTYRNSQRISKGNEMAGFPCHALDAYLPKLIRAGKRVVICDQLELQK